MQHDHTLKKLNFDPTPRVEGEAAGKIFSDPEGVKRLKFNFSEYGHANYRPPPPQIRYQTRQIQKKNF